jgi:hypothetical protein
MGRYVDWSYIVNRTPSANTAGGSKEVDSAFIIPTEFEVDGLLSTHFTTPFSSNNMTVKELVADLVYAKMNVGKDKHAVKYKERAMEMVDNLKAGTMNMILLDGTVVGAVNGTAWSNTQDYHPVFGISDEIYQTKDQDQIDHENAERRSDCIP